MENSALNRAHQHSRRADAHLRARRFEEAAECHRQAAAQLGEAMRDTQQPRALESLSLQQQHHLRQTDIIKLRKTQYEKLRHAVEKHKLICGELPEVQNPNLHVDIFRTMEEADSLMDQLLQSSSDDVTLLDDSTPAVEPSVVKGSKRPKDDKVVVEELRTLTQHLNGLVVQLFTQLDASNQENESLRAQVRMLETQLQASHLNSSPPSTATPIAPQLSDTVSPFMMPPRKDNLSPDVTPTASRPGSYNSSVLADRTLPILAPLEMPQFDFSVFHKLEEKSNTDGIQ